MALTFEISRINGVGGYIDQVKDKLDNLSLVLNYYTDVITDIGVNNDFELGELMVSELSGMMDQIDVMTKRLEHIRYGNKPFPPCHTGPTGPIGWATCI